MIGPNHLTHQDRNGQVGELLPGINDNYLGGAPNLGAHALGAPLQRYGPRNAATCGDDRVEGAGICPRPARPPAQVVIRAPPIFSAAMRRCARRSAATSPSLSALPVTAAVRQDATSLSTTTARPAVATSRPPEILRAAEILTRPAPSAVAAFARMRGSRHCSAWRFYFCGHDTAARFFAAEVRDQRRLTGRQQCMRLRDDAAVAKRSDLIAVESDLFEHSIGMLAVAWRER